MNLKEVSEYLGIGETKTRELLKSRNLSVFHERLVIGGMRIKKYWINGYKNNQRKKGGIILFDMYVSKWYSVRDKMFYKDIYIIQKGV